MLILACNKTRRMGKNRPKTEMPPRNKKPHTSKCTATRLCCRLGSIFQRYAAFDLKAVAFNEPWKFFNKEWKLRVQLGKNRCGRSFTFSYYAVVISTNSFNFKFINSKPCGVFTSSIFLKKGMRMPLNFSPCTKVVLPSPLSMSWK